MRGKRARRLPPGSARGASPTVSPAVEARMLEPGDLRWRCDPATLERVVAEAAREAKKDVPATEAERLASRGRSTLPVSTGEIVGQARALEAIRAGLAQDGPGYNIFVCGPVGSGRETLVRAALAEALGPGKRRRVLPGLGEPHDRLYVADFQRPERPRLVTLARGQGKRFRRDVDDLILALRDALGAAFDEHELRDRRERLKRRTDREARRLLTDFGEAIRDEGFVLGPIPDGFAAPSLKLEMRLGAGGPRRALTRKAILAKIAERELKKTRELEKRLERMKDLARELEAVARRARRIARRGQRRLKELDERTARAVARGPVEDLVARYPSPAVKLYAKQLLARLGDKLSVFLERHPDEPEPPHDAPPPPENERRPRDSGDPFAELRANLVVSASDRPTPPVIWEEVPSVTNLMGSLEAGDPQGPEHLRIRAGSLLAADGGVLVIEARELLQDPQAWRALKRTLGSGELRVQRFDPQSHTPAGPVRPRPVKIAVKVVLVGDDEAFRQLHETDDDFRTIFKVKVEVEDDIPNDATAREALGLSILRLARRAGLLAPDASGLAALLEHAARRAGRRDRLAARLGELLDVVREAEVEARRARGKAIAARHVEAALETRRRRHDLAERKTQELLDAGVVLVDTAGARAGQVNALAVYDTGDHVFARPARVTASTALGRAGVIDIERESHLSGDTHHKGVQIISGYLRGRYAQDKPLCLTASVCFEQSYAPIDGDSASVAEVVSILSSLADLPLDQGWGVTGSLNQKGDVQAIGDVNEKVEGFYDACKARGVDGRQGVLVPTSNVNDLMLREDIVRAVAAGRFHVRAMRTLDDALEVLAHAPAETVHERVDAKLRGLAQAWRRYDRDDSVL